MIARSQRQFVCRDCSTSIRNVIAGAGRSRHATVVIFAKSCERAESDANDAFGRNPCCGPYNDPNHRVAAASDVDFQKERTGRQLRCMLVSLDGDSPDAAELTERTCIRPALKTERSLTNYSHDETRECQVERLVMLDLSTPLNCVRATRASIFRNEHQWVTAMPCIQIDRQSGLAINASGGVGTFICRLQDEIVDGVSSQIPEMMQLMIGAPSEDHDCPRKSSSTASDMAKYATASSRR